MGGDRITSSSSEETIQRGRELAKKLSPNAVLCFFGDLGAGKTTLIKGIVEGATKLPIEEVSSPTFNYLNIYSSPHGTVYHFDLYRLKDPEEFIKMGFDEYLFAGGICCIEWSERIESLLPPSAIRLTLSHQSPEERVIYYEHPECQIC